MLIGTERNPKGPSFSRSRCVEKNLSGTKVSFLAPDSSPPFPGTSWGEEPDEIDFLDGSIFNSYEWEDAGVQWTRSFSGSWEFKGLPFVQGYCGDVSLLVDVQFSDNLSVNESLFEKDVFVREVYRLLKATNLSKTHKGHSEDPGDMTSYRWPNYLAPINSQWVSRGGVDWFYCEDQPLKGGAEQILWSTAISDKFYLTFKFLITRTANNAGNPYLIEERVPRNNFLQLMHSVMDTLKVELSTVAKMELARVEKINGVSEKVVIACSLEEQKQAKHVLYMWSDKGHDCGGRDGRAKPEDVAAFVDQRVKANPLPGSYTVGPMLQNLDKEPDSTLKAG